MWSGVRRRAGQAWAVAGLTALITACLVFAALFERAVEQGLLVARLAQESVSGRGLTLSSGDDAVRGVPLYAPVPDDPTPVNMAALVPPAFRAVAEAGVGSTVVQVRTVDRAEVRVVARDGICQHVRIVVGRCPSARNEIAVSPADSAAHHWAVGSRLVVAESTADLSAQQVHKFFTVVGLYRQVPGPYWFDEQLDGRSGTRAGFGEATRTDDWVTDFATMNGGRVDPNAPVLATLTNPVTGTAHTDLGWMRRTSTYQVPLRPRALRIDSMGGVAAAITERLNPDPATYPTVQFSSNLPAVVSDVRHGQQQVRLIVPLLMGQLAVLALAVLWLLLRAAAVQRRPEVALARLHGYGAGGAWAMVTAELGPVLIVGLAVGVALAVVAQRVVVRYVLPAGVPVEFPLTAWAAIAIAAALSLGCLTLAARRVAREPVAALLRGVPARQSGWAVGVADAMLVTIAGSAVLAMVSDRGNSPLAIAATPLLALAFALLVTHAVAVLAPPLGRRLLRQGRAAAALLTLRLSRRPSIRGLMAIVCVTTALVVFAADVYAVADRNRHAEAALEVGAPLVVSVDVPDITATEAALSELDPTGRVLTPVYQIAPVGAGGTTVDMVHPEQFRRIGSFSVDQRANPAWGRLSPPRIPPLVVQGQSMTVTLAAERPENVKFTVVLAAGDGLTRNVDFGSVDGGLHRRTVAVPCSQRCRVLALTATPINKAPSDLVLATFTVSRMHLGSGPPVALGQPGQWTPAAVQQPGDTFTVSRSREYSTVLITLSNGSGETQQVIQSAVPELAAALVGGRLPAGAAANFGSQHPAGAFTASGIDGIARGYRQVGSLPNVPGGTRSTIVTNLDTMLQEGRTQQGLPGQLQVWSARDDSATLSRLGDSLRRRGLTIGGVQRITTVQAALARSASGWGLQLGLLAALVALIVTALGIAVQTSTTWRAQTREDAALRLTGIRAATLTRLAVTEQLTVLALGVLLGAACGLLGAQLTLPSVPLFTTPPQILVQDLSTSWAGVTAATAAVLLVVALTGLAATQWVSQHTSLSRLQDTT